MKLQEYIGSFNEKYGDNIPDTSNMKPDAKEGICRIPESQRKSCRWR